MSRFVLTSGEHDEAATAVAERPVVEIGITGVESGLRQSVQQWDDFLLIIHAGVPEAMSSLPKRNLPSTRLVTLAGDHVFVNDDHAASVSGNCSDRTLSASRIASAMASRPML